MSDYSSLRGRELLLGALGDLQAELAAGVEWENDTLAMFLEGFEALLGSIENAYINTGRPVPEDTWEVLADVFRGARFYE